MLEILADKVENSAIAKAILSIQNIIVLFKIQATIPKCNTF
jgi:hypothetical protein